MQTFSSCGEQGLLSVCSTVASLDEELSAAVFAARGLSSCSPQALDHKLSSRGPQALLHHRGGILPDQGSNVGPHLPGEADP